MSKSVRSHASSSVRQRDPQEAMLKEKIREVLLAIKEERQHIENRLFENDVEITRLRKEYDLLRYDHDFEHLNEEEAVIVQQLQQGLIDNNIDPHAIMGTRTRSAHPPQQDYRQLSKEEVIDVQEVLIGQLKQLLQQ